MFCQKCQHIITGYPDGLQQILSYAAITAVWSQQSHQRVDTQKESCHKDDQYPIAQPALLLGIGLFVGLPPDAVNHVLQDTKRTDYRTVDTPHDQGKHHKRHHNHYVHS